MSLPDFLLILPLFHQFEAIDDTIHQYLIARRRIYILMVTLIKSEVQTSVVARLSKDLSDNNEANSLIRSFTILL